MREALRALPGAPRPLQGGGGPDGPAGVHQLCQGPPYPRGARVRRRAVRPVRGAIEGRLGKEQLSSLFTSHHQNSHPRRRGRVRSWWWCAGATWRARITSSSGSRWSKAEERNKRDEEEEETAADRISFLGDRILIAIASSVIQSNSLLPIRLFW